MTPKPPPTPIRVETKYLDKLYLALVKGEKKKEAQREQR